MKIRLDKYICDMGYATRREIKEHAKRGRIALDGAVVKDPGAKADTESSVVTFCGERVVYDPCPLYMMNKPAGYVCATEDPKDKTVLELMGDREQRMGLFPVGRLDKDTLGLVILTTDGVLAHKLLAPKSHVWKSYFLKSDPPLEKSDIMAFREGVFIESGVKTLPAELEILENPAEGILRIHEGKFHQIKKMLGAVKKNCSYLERIEFAGVKLDPALGRGEYRPLTNDERSALIKE